MSSAVPVVVEVATPAAVVTAAAPEDTAPVEGRQYYVYRDDRDPENHFAETVVEGDRMAVEFEPDATYLPVSGSTCLRCIYNLMDKREGWAGVTWRRPGGATVNLDGARTLKFAARGETGSERVTLGMRGAGERSERALTDLRLEKGWKEYAVPLGALDLSAVVDGFFWKVTAEKNTGGEVVFYLDDIRYEY